MASGMVQNKWARHIALTYVLESKRTYEADVRINIEVRIRKKRTYVAVKRTSERTFQFREYVYV